MGHIGGHIWDTYRTLTGHIWDTYRTLKGHMWDTYRTGDSACVRSSIALKCALSLT